MDKFYICLTFDTDPDPDINHYQLDNFKKNIFGWSGLNKGSKLISKSLLKLSKINNKKIPMTWFIRVDDQIKFCHGRADWIYQKKKKFWEYVINNNGSIQWHIHLNKISKKIWIREKSSVKINKMIEKNFQIFKKMYQEPDCIRVGEAFMSQDLSKKIKSLRIKADSSALPGRKRNDPEKAFDWTGVKNYPYYISSKNYKRPALKKSNKKFLEIPMNTLPTKCSYDKKKIKRYVNLSFHNKILKENLNKFIKQNKYLVTMTHPFEILKKFKKKINSELISFSIHEFEKNIQYIIKICKKNNKEPYFININQIIENLSVQK